MKKLAYFIATFSGWGNAPKAPGTVGSLASVLAACLFLPSRQSLKIGCALSIVLGFWATQKAGKGVDHKWIVIDETAGMWLSMLPIWPLKLTKATCSSTFLGKVILAFILFRLLDITKPGFIGRLDNCHDTTGIMGDDILAGFLVNRFLSIVAARV